jgi:hypothetical protein
MDKDFQLAAIRDAFMNFTDLFKESSLASTTLEAPS